MVLRDYWLPMIFFMPEPISSFRPSTYYCTFATLSTLLRSLYFSISSLATFFVWDLMLSSVSYSACEISSIFYRNF